MTAKRLPMKTELYRYSNSKTVPLGTAWQIAMLTTKKNGLTGKQVKEFFLKGNK